MKATAFEHCSVDNKEHDKGLATITIAVKAGEDYEPGINLFKLADNICKFANDQIWEANQCRGDREKKHSEMVYGEDGIKTSKLLYDGVYKGFHFVVLNIRGDHPCGYVNIIGHENDLDIGDSWEWINCHCGITYSSDHLADMELGTWIGWDYGHCYDYTVRDALGIPDKEKKWTVDEIVKECHDVIDQLVDAEKHLFRINARHLKEILELKSDIADSAARIEEIVNASAGRRYGFLNNTPMNNHHE